ncbi:MAG TPA: hypothetical protein VK498_11590 [Ferruginibacter sp.]|nr:hypothetical protein [Ferruginibacter sp.]
MKPTNLLLVLSLVVFTLFTSCKKTSEAESDEIETTFELSTDQGIADNLTEDDHDVMMEACADKDLVGNFVASPLESLGILSCATITVTPINGFPKTIWIDFGVVGCAGPNGVYRKGKIIIVISDSLRRPGSTSVMTFDNYYVNGFKREGTITWRNTSTVGTKSWERKVENGKITAPNGNWWLHNGIQNVVQIAGVSTPRNLLDDEITIGGHSSVSNSAGRARTAEITQILHKAYICENIDAGRIRFDGPNHFAILDFGNGVCDRIATISIDGRPPRTIVLR